ncbi:amidohydrolase [Pikeienuella piscinae]|uniref:Amidohydrolase n=1 Tax=Pikeienuella piscinae TaxID=2748098 RepID=A0A7L5C0S2_9RHOB|nr:M20 aminoacylase family protein [Pikeienuella piscinae]QIE55744.1 amidohydrolase [Pikeienuella piscinae]
MPILNSVAALQPDMVEWRHDFHRHPELEFDVHRTAGIVAEKLRAFGCDEVVEGIGRTGVVGLIRGRAGTSGRVVGLRSDMDALPIAEATGAAHASTVPGKMHACGHDGHMAMLLGAAKHLAETRNFDGAVAVIFQPAEEAGAGGEKMVQDGLMERFGVTEVYGMHNMPDLPVGQFAIRSGPALASTDEFTITFTGKGGHAAKPHFCIDPTVAACRFVRAAQSVVSRSLDPTEMMVVTVCSLTTAESYNVIPQTARMTGTVRCYSEENRAMARERLDALAAGIAASAGAVGAVEWERGYPPTVNDPERAAFAAETAEEIAGACIRDTPPLLGAEDFAYMLEARPGAMIMVGNGPSAACHHPAYDFADETMPAGASYWVRLAERALPLS